MDTKIKWVDHGTWVGTRLGDYDIAVGRHTTWGNAKASFMVYCRMPGGLWTRIEETYASFEDGKADALRQFFVWRLQKG